MLDDKAKIERKGFTLLSLILLNGGIGTRVGADKPKQLIRINGIPIFIYALRVADQIEEISQVILNCPAGWEDEMKGLTQKYAIQTPLFFVEAGKTRHESVALMVKHAQTKHVLVHEAARPQATVEDFITLIQHPEDNVSLTRPIPFTVLQKEAGTDKIGGVLDREQLLNIQLPQKFSTATLQAAHAAAASAGEVFTEDAALVHESGADVYFIDGAEQNFKVTTLQDVYMAEYIMGGIKEHMKDE